MLKCTWTRRMRSTRKAEKNLGCLAMVFSYREVKMKGVEDRDEMREKGSFIAVAEENMDSHF